MTITTESIGNVQGGGYPIDAGGDIGDLAFAIAAYQLQSLDEELCENMGRIKIIGEIKKAYRERLAQIREWLESEKDGKVLVPADEARKLEYGSGGLDGAPEALDGGPLDGKADRYYLVDENGDKIRIPLQDRFEWRDGVLIDTGHSGRGFADAQGTEGMIRALAEHYPGSTVMVELKKETLENEVSRIEGILGDLNSDGEIQLLNINRLLSRRNQAMQLASNIMSSTHQTAMGVISNIK
jgi:hypothetical protein